MNITLTPTFTLPNYRIPRFEYGIIITPVAEMHRIVKNADLASKPVAVTFDSALDAEGNHYGEITFIVTARWTTADGHMWVAGSGFQVDLTDFLNRTREAIENS